MKKLTMLAGASLLVLAGSVFAAEPLNDAQMDGISAGALGATAVAWAGGSFTGDAVSTTSVNSTALAYPLGFGIVNPITGQLLVASPVMGLGFAYGQSDSTTLATSVYGAAAANSVSHANAGLQI